MIFDKSAKNIQGGMTVFSTNGAGKPRYPETGPLSYTKINSKWMKNLNVIPETIQLLEENIGKKFYYVVLGNDFMGTKTKGSQGKNRWGYIKLKKLLHMLI